jgi:Amt family ammonium transporter
MDAFKTSTDVFFLLMGAVMVTAMHAGFAFLEVGTVRKKNQVNALIKIFTDFCISVIAYFFIGYTIAYGIDFFGPAPMISGAAEKAPEAYGKNGYTLMKFFFLLTFAAAVPAIISGGIAERAKFWPQAIASGLIVAVLYPLFEGVVWGERFGVQKWFEGTFGAKFTDFAGSIVVHCVGGWMALAAVLLLGARRGRYRKDGTVVGIPPSNIPFLALGSWALSVGWFGFNVMSAQKVADITGLVAVNSLMAMAGGLLAATVVGNKDPGFVHNGPLAGLVAICAGSALMHPIGALATGAVAGGLFVIAFNLCQNRLKIDDVLGVWPLHGLCGLWGGIAAGIFGATALGGMGGVSFMAQLVGSLIGAAYAFAAGGLVYLVLRTLFGIRLTEEEEHIGADLAIHKIGAYPEDELGRPR